LDDRPSEEEIGKKEGGRKEILKKGKGKGKWKWVEMEKEKKCENKRKEKDIRKVKGRNF
jgi:hypothetical protein